MICILALIVFGILGIFSARYRTIAKEAFSCVVRRVQLKKCDTALNMQLKSELVGKFMKLSPRMGRFLYKYFECFSWFFLILTLATIGLIGQGVYNYAAYGNCNGPNSDQFCIFDPIGTNAPDSTGNGEMCVIPMHQMNKTLTRPDIELVHDGHWGNQNASVTIIEFGCYSCPFTRKAESVVKKIFEKYDDRILYIYIDFPLSLTHENALLASEAAHCALNQEKYWEYRDYLFANQPKQYYDDLISYAKELGLDEKQFRKCLDKEKYKDMVNKNYNIGVESGVTVTPTFFINNRTIIGAKNYGEFKRAIDEELGLSFWERLFS